MRSSSHHCRLTAEIGIIVEETFEAAVMGHLFPRSQIDIFIEVLQSDGGGLHTWLLPTQPFNHAITT